MDSKVDAGVFVKICLCNSVRRGIKVGSFVEVVLGKAVVIGEQALKTKANRIIFFIFLTA